MRRTPTVPARLAVAAALIAPLALAACTGGSKPVAPESTTITHTVVHTVTPSIDPNPIVAGPTTSATGDCPLLGRQNVANKVGMRLDRQTVQRSGGQVVGCTFYPLTHPNAQCDAQCLAGERLPPASQPAVKITLERYKSATAARNAMVLRSRTGTDVQQVAVGAAGTGLAYKVDFYSGDHGQDWACAFTHGTTLAVVEATVTNPSYNVVAVATQLAGVVK